jgi:hypothetical protein
LGRPVPELGIHGPESAETRRDRTLNFRAALPIDHGDRDAVGKSMNLSGAGWLFVGVGAVGCAALAWLDSNRHFRRRQQDGHHNH